MDNYIEAQNNEGEVLINQLQQRFVGYWRRLTATIDSESANDETDSFVSEYLANLKERAYLERTVANQYRGRYLIELIQNAVDAMHMHADLSQNLTRNFTDESYYNDEMEEDLNREGYRCHIELTPEALYVANDGQVFGANDVRGVSAMGQSTKPAGEYIGYKGLGFRAVLEISDSPEIYSGPYQFGFSSSETLALLDGTNLRPDMAEVPVLSVPFLRSVTSPGLISSEREVLERLLKNGYATIVRLPLKSVPRQLYSDVREACQQLLTDQTLLFLPYITELSVAITDTGSGIVNTISKNSYEVVIKPKSLAEVVKVSRLTFKQTETLKGARARQAEVMGSVPKTIPPQDWLLIEARQPLVIPDVNLITELQDNTWKGVRQVGLAAAFPLARLPWGGGDVFLKRRPSSLPFFAHFPTQEGSGFGFAVSSDFYLSASRKQIEWDVSYNQWLSSSVVGYICGPVLDAVHYLYPDDAALIEILTDNALYNDRFGRNFRKIMDNRLTNTALVPVGNGIYKPPANVVWSPLEQDGVLIFRRVFRYLGDDLDYPVLQLEQIHSAEPYSTFSTSSPVTDNTTSMRDYDRYDDYSDKEPHRYDYDDLDSDRYDTERNNDAEPEFDYKRIRKFLSDLGVKILSPDHLSQIFGFALETWESGLLLTGEICAALALWYAELAKGEAASTVQRSFIEQARLLPVIPTTTAGWQTPDNPAFSYVDASTAIIADDFDAEKILGSNRASLLAATAPDRTILEIDPASYDLPEYAGLVRAWFRALGIR